MTVQISKISLIVFVVLLILSGFVLSIPGDFWPWYAVLAIIALAPVVCGPVRYRVFGTLALILCASLIANDMAAGKRFRAQHPEFLPEEVNFV